MKGEKILDIPGISYLWKLENLYLAGQPSVETFDALKEQNIKTIINLRSAEEADQSAIISRAKELGIGYEQFPIIVNGALDPANCEKLSKMLNKDDSFFIHCGSANRVGGWLITYLVKYRNISIDDAIEIASNNGLSNPGFINQAIEIIEA